MIWLLLALAQGQARAEAPHLPAEMQQKADDVGAALREGFHRAKRKVKNAEADSDFVHSAVGELSQLWGKAKAKGRSAIVYLDHELHEHVLGDGSGAQR